MLTAEIIDTVPVVQTATKSSNRPARVRTNNGSLAHPRIDPNDTRNGSVFARDVSIRDFLLSVYGGEEKSSTGLNIPCPESSAPDGENVRIHDDADADRATVHSETLATLLELEPSTHTLTSWDWLIQVVCKQDKNLAGRIVKLVPHDEIADLVQEFTTDLVTDLSALRSAVKLAQDTEEATIPFATALADEPAERPSTNWQIADGYFVTLEPGRLGTYKTEKSFDKETNEVNYSDRLVRPYVVYATHRRRQMQVSMEGAPRPLAGSDEVKIAILDRRGNVYESDWMPAADARTWGGIDSVDAPIAKPLSRTDTEAILNGIRVLNREDRIESVNWTSMGWVQKDANTIAYLAPASSYERGIGVTDVYSVQPDSRSDDGALSDFDLSVGLAPLSETDDERIAALRAATVDLFDFLDDKTMTVLIGAFGAALLGVPGFTANLTAESDSGKSLVAALVQGLTSDYAPDGDAVGIYLPMSRPGGIKTKASFYRHCYLFMDDYRVSRGSAAVSRSTDTVQEVVQGIYGSVGAAVGSGAGSLARVTGIRTSAVMTSEIIHPEKAIRRRMMIVRMPSLTEDDHKRRFEWIEQKHLVARGFMGDLVAWLADRMHDAGGVEKFIRAMRRRTSLATGRFGGIDVVGRCAVAWEIIAEYAEAIGDAHTVRWITEQIIGTLLPEIAVTQKERVRESSPAVDVLNWLTEQFQAGNASFDPFDGSPHGVRDGGDLNTLGWRHDTARQAWVPGRMNLGIASEKMDMVFVNKASVRAALKETQHDPATTPIADLLKTYVVAGTTPGGAIPSSTGIADARGKKGYMFPAAAFFGKAPREAYDNDKPFG